MLQHFSDCFSDLFLLILSFFFHTCMCITNVLSTFLQFFHFQLDPMKAPRDHMQPKPAIVNVGPQLFHSPQAPSQLPPSSHSAQPPSSHQFMQSQPPPSHFSSQPHPPPSQSSQSHSSHIPPPPPFTDDDNNTDHSTVPLEPMSMSPKLAATLEHIVGQLDILTQVTH